MKEIDIGDEVRVKNRNGIFIVDGCRQVPRYDNGEHKEAAMVYSLKSDKDGAGVYNSSKVVYAEYEEILPLKSLKQKIDAKLDDYNWLMFLSNSYPDGDYGKQAEYIMKQLRK